MVFYQNHFLDFKTYNTYVKLLLEHLKYGIDILQLGDEVFVVYLHYIAILMLNYC